MSALKPIVYDGGIMRQVAQGDVVAGAEQIPATLAGGAITATGPMLTAGFIQLTSVGATAVTVDTAANIIAAISGGLNTSGVQNGTTFRNRVIQNAAFAATFAPTANTGVTVTNGVVNASSVKDFLVTVVNGSPARNTMNTLATTNASAVVTGFTAADVAAITPGMVVTNAVAGLQGATVLGVNMTNNSVTLSANANATLAGQALSFSPVVTVAGIGQALL